MSSRYIPLDSVITDAVGKVTQLWREYLQFLTGDVAALQQEVNQVIGVNVGVLADQPTGLTADDEGYLYGVSDYGHLVRWSGSVWEWAPGDPGNDYFQDFRAAPTQTGWAFCDGSTVARLTVGAATLTTTNVTLPNFNATPGFLQGGSAYSGPGIDAAVAPGLSGTSGATAPGISGSVANESSHTHDIDLDSTGEILEGIPTISNYAAPGAAQFDHHHNTQGTSGAGSAHNHGVGTLAVDSHTHGIGSYAADATGLPALVTTLRYYRR